MRKAIIICGAYISFFLLLVLGGCASSRLTADIDVDTIKLPADPLGRYSGEWGKIQTQKEGCVDLTGQYVVVSTPGKDNPDGGPYGANGKVGLGSLVRLQSHNWPLKYSLADEKSVLIKSSADSSSIEFWFTIEVIPFISYLSDYTCVNGWTRIQYQEEFGSEGGWFDALGDVYLSKTSTGDLVIFNRLWSKNIAFLGLHRYERSQEHWFLYKTYEKR